MLLLSTRFVLPAKSTSIHCPIVLLSNEERKILVTDLAAISARGEHSPSPNNPSLSVDLLVPQAAASS